LEMAKSCFVNACEHQEAAAANASQNKILFKLDVERENLSLCRFLKHLFAAYERAVTKQNKREKRIEVAGEQIEPIIEVVEQLPAVDVEEEKFEVDMDVEAGNLVL